MGRTLVVGDIHGGLAALRQVLSRADVEPDDRLIFLGDYVDGWSDSAQVINYLMELEQQHLCVFLLGNHDLRCMQWLRNGEVHEQWITVGGAATIKSYQTISIAQRAQHLAFLERMAYYYEDDKRRLFIHAGYSSDKGPSAELFSNTYIWDRTLWQEAMLIHDTNHILVSPVGQRLQLYQEIYIGHTPTTNFKQTTPMHRSNVWNIDTGAGFEGKLTILDVDSKSFWQSNALPELYPDEVGRN